jgi:hypothetical protein
MNLIRKDCQDVQRDKNGIPHTHTTVLLTKKILTFFCWRLSGIYVVRLSAECLKTPKRIKLVKLVQKRSFKVETLDIPAVSGIAGKM